MRLELSGSFAKPPPLAVKLLNGIPFIPQQYIDQGYTDYDVMVIGAGGGRGGGIKSGGTGTNVRSFGGSGGGGGTHRVRGKLEGLPPSCEVVVGSAGSNGSDHVSDPGSTSDGGDGGYSSFANPICRASGGKGGFHVQTNSLTLSSQGNGGQGGLGDRILAGGGAIGGIAGTPTATGPGTPGTAGDWGEWNGVVGEGGGGGAGGVGTYSGVTANAATQSGGGSYDPGDTSVYSNPSSISADTTESGAASIVPGRAGGARATPLNQLPTTYGDSGQDGYVVIRLTAV